MINRKVRTTSSYGSPHHEPHQPCHHRSRQGSFNRVQMNVRPIGRPRKPRTETTHRRICTKGVALKDSHGDPDRPSTPQIKRNGVFDPAT